MSFFKKLFGIKEKNNQVEEPQLSSQPVVEETTKEEPQVEETTREELKVDVMTEEEAKVEEATKEEPQEEETSKEDPQIEEQTKVESQTEEVAKEELKVEEAPKSEPVLEQSTIHMSKVEESIIEESVEEEQVVEESISEVQEEVFLPEVVEEVVEQAEEPKKKVGFFKKLVAGLEKTRSQFIDTVDEVLKGFKKIDEDLFEELEEVLIMADYGVDTTLAIIEQLREKVKTDKLTEPEQLKKALQDIITEILTSNDDAPIIVKGQPNVVLVIGVNGVGKTTTIGKLAHQLREDNQKVVLAAADTFRAAAIEQLQIWANRAQVDLIKQSEGSDPASVVYDGIQAAKARQADVLICDTAGRLQNKTNLMKELEKIGRIIDREYPEAHKEVLIVLDATTGQNAISQVKVFKEVAQVDGIVLTKLDGTAKGGAIVGICQSLKVPVKYIGVGEQIDDLQPFEAASFAAALFEQDKK